MSDSLAIWLAIALDFALVIALGWHLFDVSAAQKKTADELADHREKVGREYALRVDVKEDLKEIKEALAEIFKLLRDVRGNR